MNATIRSREYARLSDASNIDEGKTALTVPILLLLDNTKRDSVPDCDRLFPNDRRTIYAPIDNRPSSKFKVKVKPNLFFEGNRRDKSQEVQDFI